MFSEFARQALLRSTGSLVVLDGRELRGFFRDDFERIAFADRIVSGRAISCRISSADLGSARKGSELEHEGVLYRVETVEHRHGGFTTLTLASTI